MILLKLYSILVICDGSNIPHSLHIFYKLKFFLESASLFYSELTVLKFWFHFATNCLYTEIQFMLPAIISSNNNAKGSLVQA